MARHLAQDFGSEQLRMSAGISYGCGSSSCYCSGLAKEVADMPCRLLYKLEVISHTLTITSTHRDTIHTHV